MTSLEGRGEAKDDISRGKRGSARKGHGKVLGNRDEESRRENRKERGRRVEMKKSEGGRSRTC